MWKEIFPIRRLDHAHANTYWEITFSFLRVWKKYFVVDTLKRHMCSHTPLWINVSVARHEKIIFPIRCLDHAHANTLW